MKYNESQLKTINSLKRIDDNIYTLHYQNNYGREQVISKSIGKIFSDYYNVQKYFKADSLLINPLSPRGGCIGITAFKENDEVLFSRNFDYRETNLIIVWVDNQEGYKSVGLVDFNFLGYDKNILKIENSNKARLLAAPYVCMDGINEKGIGISVIEVKFDPTKQRNGRTRLIPTMILRQVLDTCSTIDEVINVFNKFDMQSTLGNDYHFHVSDSKGNAIVIEYINNKLVIIRNNDIEYYPKRFMYVPSFYISKQGNNKNITKYASERYNIAKEDMHKKDGVYNEKELFDLLKRCKTNHRHKWLPHNVKTVWSVAYNLNTLSARICANNNFEDIYEFNLHKPQEIKLV